MGGEGVGVGLELLLVALHEVLHHGAAVVLGVVVHEDAALDGVAGDLDGGDTSAYFASCNRGKRSIAIDLRHPDARPLLEALIRDADVLIENFRADAAVSLRLDPASTRALNPRLIHCAISGYGRSGPAAHRPGYDFAIQAEAGLMAITGPADGPPSKVGVASVDLTTGLNATIAILAALLQRARTGEGQTIELSLFDVQVQALANVASSTLFTGNEAKRYGNAHASIVPYQTFDATDGAFALACGSDALWQWHPQVVALSRHFRLFVPDLLYFGQSVGHGDDFSLEGTLDVGGTLRHPELRGELTVERSAASCNFDEARHQIREVVEVTLANAGAAPVEVVPSDLVSRLVTLG